MTPMTKSDAFEEQGYLVRRQLFSEDEMRVLEEALRSARPRFPTTLNKKGLEFREFLHFHSPQLQAFLSSEKIVDLLKPYLGGDFWLRKDQSVGKAPGGAEFPWHQDNAYNQLKDAYCQLWIAVTDIAPENGGLYLLPGTHRGGILPHRHAGNHVCWEGNSGEGVAVTARRGDALLFSSMLLHRSGPNRTGKERLAYVAEYMSSAHLDPFARPPYFRVARGGRPDPKFIRFYEGNLSLRNQLHYAIPRLKWNAGLVREGLRLGAKRLLGKS